MVGRLRRLTLRDVWRHEALDFTRWLEGNIEVLAEVLDLELTVAGREQAAGSLNVDLIAEDGAGHVVVIENQLERSNHDHLGKLVTYLSVVEARAAVWIVAEPRPEHVTAITWLNEASSASFYLVKAEAVAIGDSDPAPLLTLIVGPSEEVREAGETKRELAERHVVRRRFWTGLLALARGRTQLHSAISPSTENWIGTGAGLSGLAFNYVVTQHSARVELYIDRRDETENQRVYDYFRQHRDDIEGGFRKPLDWQSLPNRRASRISYHVADRGYKDEEDSWPQLHAEMVDAMIRLERALRPHLGVLR